MKQLSYHQLEEIVNRLPTFKLSYETVSHKKVSQDYHVTMAIPYGKKALLWHTFYKNKKVCLLLLLEAGAGAGKDQKVTSVHMVSDQVDLPLAYGTLLYGCLCSIDDRDPFFVIEDPLFYQGIPLYKQPFSEKLHFLRQLFEYHHIAHLYDDLPVCLPVCWNIQDDPNTIPQTLTIPYSIHHLQHRPDSKLVPYINYPWAKHAIPSTSKQSAAEIPSHLLFVPPPLPRFHYSNPQYKLKTTFEVKADLQNDIYHLYAFGKKSERVYCGIAYIPDYESSKFMNGLFRRIKENANLDALEESDDEEEFEDIRMDKFVDLEKKVVMDCVFRSKFRRWVPVASAGKGTPVIHIKHL
jgi:hypothetical protein